jgi:hypothetical protein
MAELRKQAKAAALVGRSGVPLAWKAEAAAVPRDDALLRS